MVTEAYLDKLINHTQQALEIYPNSPAPYQHLGNIYTFQRKFEKAISYYIEAIKQLSAPSSCFYRLKWSLDAMSWMGGCKNPVLLENGVLALQAFIRRKPDFYFPKVVLGNLLSQQGKIEDAIAHYQSASYQQTSKSYPQLVNTSWDSKHSRKPDFLIVGFPKCGTTSLYRYLASHPQVLPAVTKEIRYRSFSATRTIETYLAHFPRIQNPDYLTFEASPSSASSPAFLKEISQQFSSIKIILLLRNPVDHIASSFYHNQRFLSTYSAQPFERAMANVFDLLGNVPESISDWIDCISSMGSLDAFTFNSFYNREVWNGNFKIFSDSRISSNESFLLFYVLNRFYIDHLKAWLHYFSKDQVLILKSEDLFQKTPETLSTVYDFLNLPEHTLAGYQNFNPGSYPSISADCRCQLADLFRPYNQQLEDFLDKQLDWD